ncbi:hypothetical protein LINPERPRIM_LOCUS22802 [Linum perenne]
MPKPHSFFFIFLNLDLLTLTNTIFHHDQGLNRSFIPEPGFS